MFWWFHGRIKNILYFWELLILWRSISAKIQCSILLSYLQNLSYILCLSFEFALKIQLFCIQHSTFYKQQSSFRIRPSSSVECTFIFSHPTFVLSVFASHIRLWALNLQVSAFDIQLFELNFYPLLRVRWRSRAQLTWPTQAQMVVESRSRDFSVEWSRESFSTPDNWTSTDVFTTVW